MKKNNWITILGFLFLTMLSYGQQTVNLVNVLDAPQLTVVNRTLSLYEKEPAAVEMNAAEGDGLCILDIGPFQTGSIEVELLGENSPGRSFIGIAFNIQDEETFEAIYFRPFNFVAKEQIRKEHMVQYICHPEYTWSILREERPGEFENEIPHPPDPEGWFSTIIQVSEDSVAVFLKDQVDPLLEVERLTSGKSNRIGLWVGNGSSGRFKDLVLYRK